MREKREKDESGEVFASIDKDRYSTTFQKFKIWYLLYYTDDEILNFSLKTPFVLRDGMICRGDLTKTLVSLGQQGTDQQVSFPQNFSFDLAVTKISKWALNFCRSSGLGEFGSAFVSLRFQP